MLSLRFSETGFGFRPSFELVIPIHAALLGLNYFYFSILLQRCKVYSQSEIEKITQTKGQ